MKKQYIILGLLVIGVIFTACGDSRGNSNKKEAVIGVFMEDKNKTIEKIEVDVNCVIPAMIDNYIELINGDNIVKKEANTTISIYHDENSNKRICLDYGEAYIEREEN